MCIALFLAASIVVAPGQKASPNVPPQALKQFENLLGEWEFKGKVNNDSVSGTFAAKWAPGKHMLIVTMTWSGPDGDSVATGIDGWDGAKKEIVTSEFWSDGWSHQRRYKIVSPTVWEATESIGATGKGEPLAGTARVEFNGADKFTWTGTSKIGDGTQEKASITFERKRTDRKSL